MSVIDASPKHEAKRGRATVTSSYNEKLKQSKPQMYRFYSMPFDSVA